MVIPVQATLTSSWLSTTQVEASSGRISLGHRVLILLMELQPTLQETSMWQEVPMEDWMVIPVQESMTSSWLSTTQVELSSGRISLGHQGFFTVRHTPGKFPFSCKNNPINEVFCELITRRNELQDTHTHLPSPIAKNISIKGTKTLLTAILF